MVTGGRKQRVGVVLSDKMEKTITVGVTWSQRERLYNKAVRRMTKFKAHDEENTARRGDRVLIEETRPLSRHKRWRLVQVIEAADLAEVSPAELEPEEGARAGADEA